MGEVTNNMEAKLMKRAIQQPVDREWVELIMRAKKMGLKIEEIQSFIRKDRQQEEQYPKSFTKFKAL